MPHTTPTNTPTQSDPGPVNVEFFAHLKERMEVFLTVPDVASNTFFSHNVKYRVQTKRSNGTLVLKPIARMPL